MKLTKNRQYGRIGRFARFGRKTRKKHEKSRKTPDFPLSGKPGLLGEIRTPENPCIQTFAGHICLPPLKQWSIGAVWADSRKSGSGPTRGNWPKTQGLLGEKFVGMPLYLAGKPGFWPFLGILIFRVYRDMEIYDEIVSKL